MDAFWSTAFAIGVAQGLFLTAALLWKKTGNPGATRALAALAAVFTLLILGELLETFIDSPSRFLILLTNINTELAIGPLLLLFVRFLFDPDHRLTHRDWLQYSPLLVALVIWLNAYGPLIRGEISATSFRNAIAGFVLFKAVYLYVYLTLAYRALNRGITGTDRISSGRQTVNLNWLKGWFIVLGIVAAFIYATFFLDHLGVTVPFDSDDIGSLLLALIIYLVSLMVVVRPWVLSIRPRSADQERHAIECQKLRDHLEREMAYLEPELTLRDLADALDCSENQLSRVINEGMATSFYDLLNHYRLSCFERLASDPDLNSRSVLELALDSGFNSKASFYRVFRRAHGMTPTSYRARMLSD